MGQALHKPHNSVKGVFSPNVDYGSKVPIGISGKQIHVAETDNLRPTALVDEWVFMNI
jgi:hypothetical protein